MGFSHGGMLVGAIWAFMQTNLRERFLELVAIGVGAWLIYTSAIVRPTVVLPATPTPNNRWRPFREDDAQAFSESDGVLPDGAEVVTDLPKDYRKANISSSGRGCCVFRSGDHAAHWQNEPALYGWPEWMVSKGIEGGGYPEKVDKLIPEIAKDRGLPVPNYAQHTGGDATVLERMLATGRMVCVTYDGRDGFYKGSVGHMVNLVFLNDKEAAILDNNRINHYVVMSRNEFIDRWKAAGGGWAWCLLNPPPPAPPKN